MSIGKTRCKFPLPTCQLSVFFCTRKNMVIEKPKCLVPWFDCDESLTWRGLNSNLG
jgi:hypothetical protein